MKKLVNQLALFVTAGLLVSVPARAQDLFVKADRQGIIVSPSALPSDLPGGWACTQDTRTGLMWAIRRLSGVNDSDHTYTWKSGAFGNVGNTSSCGNSLAPLRCNTEDYINRLNDMIFCGSTNWRLPAGTYRFGSASNSPSGELAVLFQNVFQTPTVLEPEQWLPNMQPERYWTGTRDSFNFGRTWLVDFGTGQVASFFWEQRFPVIAVTSDQPAIPAPVPPDPDDPPELSPPPEFVHTDILFSSEFDNEMFQGFNDFDDPVLAQWLLANQSEPEGEAGWTLGDQNVFPAFDGGPNDYLAASYEATTGTGTIGAWLLSPLLEFREDSRLVFFTKALDSSIFPDRLEIRACIGDPCNLVGADPFGVGDFTIPIATINRELEPSVDPTGITGFPDRWTRFEFGDDRGVPSSGRGRIAFRYIVTDAGPNGNNSLYVGLDAISISADLASP